MAGSDKAGFKFMRSDFRVHAVNRCALPKCCLSPWGFLLLVSFAIFLHWVQAGDLVVSFLQMPALPQDDARLAPPGFSPPGAWPQSCCGTSAGPLGHS